MEVGTVPRVGDYMLSRSSTDPYNDFGEVVSISDTQTTIRARHGRTILLDMGAEHLVVDRQLITDYMQELVEELHDRRQKCFGELGRGKTMSKLTCGPLQEQAVDWHEPLVDRAHQTWGKSGLPDDLWDKVVYLIFCPPAA